MPTAGNEPQTARNSLMETTAVVLDEPARLALKALNLTPPSESDVVVDVQWSGISTGTEKLLWNGTMPPFPGMGYPLVPGYEAVGQVRTAGENVDVAPGQSVFVPGAKCFDGVNGLFGASASRLVVDAKRVVPLPAAMGESGVLLALAATAHHALTLPGSNPPDLIIGHGVLGRLLARLTIAMDAPPPVVWEHSEQRRADADGYDVIDGARDTNASYGTVVDASGDPAILDTAIAHAAKGCSITLAGFYHEPLAFAFPPAFMREATIRIAAEFQPSDISAVLALIEAGRLSLEGLISHRAAASDAQAAYSTAFGDPDCLKMVLDWRTIA